LCVKMLHRDSTIQKYFRVRRFSIPCQPSGRSSHPVRTLIYHCSIRPDDVPYRPDSRQTKHHLSGRRVFLSGPSTVSRRFYLACICPDVSAARPNASQYSNSLRFFPSCNKRKIDQPSGRLTAVVRTCVHQRRKLPIRLQPSGRSKPYKEITRPFRLCAIPS
jgi:hypothetical protein